MIFTRLTGVTTYRMRGPRWASAPLSGAGAAAHGGRANRPGIAALYLAFEPETAIDEFRHVSSLLRPGTLVSYRLRIDPVLDFRSGYVASKWPPLWAEFFCDWRKLWFNDHIEPPGWVLGDDALSAGAKGIIFASQARKGGTNLVVYTDAVATSDSVEVYDPYDELPKNQDSWD